MEFNIDSVTISELKPGERLKKKNGKKLIRGHGSKRIKVTSTESDHNDWCIDKGKDK